MRPPSTVKYQQKEVENKKKKKKKKEDEDLNRPTDRPRG